ncbi:MAG: Trp family transcriptional regulator [Patescibacteria group bacterium]
MAKVQHRQLKKSELEVLRQELFETLQKLGVKEKGREFLDDLLTESEKVMLARRIQIAKRLLLGEAFEEIARSLHVGMATIQAVDRWLQRKFDRYRSDLPPLMKTKRRVPIGHLDPHSMRGIRARYPVHFGIINFLLGDPREEFEE